MCVDEATAEKVAKRKALGRLGALRKSIPTFRVKIGDDWLFGFVKTKYRWGNLVVAVKFTYVDCKGVALEKIPPEVEEKVGELARNIAVLFGRELSKNG